MTIKQNEKLIEEYQKVVVNESESWDAVYERTRDEQLNVFEMVEFDFDLDDPKQKKLYDAWDKAQRDWIKADKVFTKVLAAWRKL
jgi:hypothetical protein